MRIEVYRRRGEGGRVREMGVRDERGGMREMG